MSKRESYWVGSTNIRIVRCTAVRMRRTDSSHIILTRHSTCPSDRAHVILPCHKSFSSYFKSLQDANMQSLSLKKVGIYFFCCICNSCWLKMWIANCRRLTLFIEILSYLIILLYLFFFFWVKRKIITLTHFMIKFTVNLNYVFICNKTSLPPSMWEIWLRNVMLGDSV